MCSHIVNHKAQNHKNHDFSTKKACINFPKKTSRGVTLEHLHAKFQPNRLKIRRGTAANGHTHIYIYILERRETTSKLGVKAHVPSFRLLWLLLVLKRFSAITLIWIHHFKGLIVETDGIREGNVVLKSCGKRLRIRDAIKGQSWPSRIRPCVRACVRPSVTSPTLYG